MLYRIKCLYDNVANKIVVINIILFRLLISIPEGVFGGYVTATILKTVEIKFLWVGIFFYDRFRLL